MGFWKNLFRDSALYRAFIVSRQEREIRRFYTDAYEDIRKQTEYYQRFNDDTFATQRVRLNRLENEIRLRMDSIDSKTEKLVSSGVTSEVERVLQNNQTFLNNLGYTNYQLNPRFTVSVADKVITGQIYNGFGLSSSIWGNNAGRQRQIREIISRGILQGKSTAEIAKQLEQFVNPKRRSPVMSGTNSSIDYNAQRLARTSVQHAYQLAFVEATKDNPFIEAYRWITSGMSNVCQLCISREEDDEYGLGAGIYPKDALPLDHPNGNCTFEVVTSWSEEDARAAVMDWMFGEGDEELNEQLDKFAESLY